VDILKSYELQANSYLSKPVQLEAFETLVKSINDFWLIKAKLPQLLAPWLAPSRLELLSGLCVHVLISRISQPRVGYRSSRGGSLTGSPGGRFLYISRRFAKAVAEAGRAGTSSELWDALSVGRAAV